MTESVIFCDFDGTICIPDSSEYLLEKFGGPEWKILEQQVWDGTITEREAFPKQLATMLVRWPEAKAELLRGIQIRDGFRDFIQWTRDRGIPFMILSSGLRILLDELLDQAEVKGVPICSQDVRVQGEKWEFVPYSGERFEEHCSLCKCVFLERARNGGKRIIYIGDGYTDLCPSRRADILFATGDLARSCQDNGCKPFHTFETFYDIERTLNALIQEEQEFRL